jgi:cytochrome oxidase assembly protein ShyY1
VMDDDGALALNHWKLIELTGHYTEKTALIGGKMEQKQPGYNLLQLFQTDLGTQVIVERGWLPREDINTHFDSAMEGIEAVTLIGQLRPIRFKFEMDPVSAPDFPAPVWRPASQGEIHRRWLPDNPQVIVTAGPVLREHQSKDLTSMPYSGFVPTPAEYNSFFYAIQWFLISAILLGIGISLGVDRSNEETPSA